MDNNYFNEIEPHLQELAGRLKHIGIVLVSVMLVIFLFNPVKLTYGLTGSFTVYMFNVITHDIGDLKIITISPFESLFTDLYLGLVLSLMIILPYILYEMFAFILPGISAREKKLLKISLIPGTAMFIVGIMFAWYLLIPLMFHFTVVMDNAMNIEPTVSAEKLIGLLLTIIFAMGLVFEMPLIVSSLIYLNIVSTQFLMKNWKYAVFGSFVIAWLVSPGATGGLIETAMGLIFSALYFSGVGIGKITEKRKMRYVYGVEA